MDAAVNAISKRPRLRPKVNAPECPCFGIECTRSITARTPPWPWKICGLNGSKRLSMSRSVVGIGTA